MEPFSLGRLLAATGQRMRADLAERLIAHPGELGAHREEIIRQFLRAYLPKRFEVSSGFAFDSAGHISQQLDVSRSPTRALTREWRRRPPSPSTQGPDG
jgi:hypothetical protein